MTDQLPGEYVRAVIQFIDPDDPGAVEGLWLIRQRPGVYVLDNDPLNEQWKHGATLHLPDEWFEDSPPWPIINLWPDGRAERQTTA